MATGTDTDKMSALEGRIDDLEQNLAAAEAKEEQEAKEFEKQVQQEVRQKLEALGQSNSYNVNSAFLNIEQRFDDHAKSGIQARQTDVLRLNKIVRDVAKGLGSDWKSVFTYIMAGTDKEELDSLVQNIEKQRPVMQAFKAMTVWKESKDAVDIEQLIEALQVWDKAELADHVKAILYSEGDELLKIGQVPVAKVTPKDEDEGEGEKGSTEGARPTINTPYKENLPDRKLLQIAKKVGPAWLDLASMLGLAETDTDEIKEAEGQTYQGAFKALWTWRDRTLDTDINQLQVLTEALKACNMADVVETLQQ